MCCVRPSWVEGLLSIRLCGISSLVGACDKRGKLPELSHVVLRGATSLIDNPKA